MVWVVWVVWVQGVPFPGFWHRAARFGFVKLEGVSVSEVTPPPPNQCLGIGTLFLVRVLVTLRSTAVVVDAVSAANRLP